MTTNEIIQLLGVLYLVMGTSFLLNKKYYRSIFKDLIKSDIFKFLGGYIALIVGFIILLNFNNFSSINEGLVTIIGGIALMKGIVLLLFPNSFPKSIKILIKKENFQLLSIFMIILGIGFICLGYFM